MNSHHASLGGLITACVLVTVSFSFTGSLTGQAAWTKLAPTTSPSGRSAHVMCTDPVRKVTVLFGGLGNTETWEWNGTNWKKMAPLTSPPGLGYAGMSYDSGRKVCVLFGGRTGAARMNQTWEWNGTNWTQVKTANSPAIRYGHGQCYDSRRGVTVVFSGFNALPYYPDTWEYDGKDWKQVATTGPIGRIYCRMEYDFLRGKCVMFSGYATGATPSVDIQDTWEWDGKAWKEIKLACQPPARWGHGMCYVLPRGIVMFGGHKQTAPGSGARNDTWLYNGKSWSEIKPTNAPTVRRLHALATDPGSTRILLFGGTSGTAETHVLDLKNFSPAMYEPYGTSCKGTNGNPNLDALNCNPPFINETFTARVTNIPSGAKVYFIIGLSNTTWNSNSLPMDWTFMGFNGCSLHTSLDIFFTIPTTGTTALFAAPVPNSGALVGTTFYNQAFVFDSGANPPGATLSNGAAGQVGRR
ncbi:MAG: Kelch repeat-containing protein [Planctomycetota bacterium]|jgi:hypothetical protein